MNEFMPKQEDVAKKNMKGEKRGHIGTLGSPCVRICNRQEVKKGGDLGKVISQKEEEDNMVKVLSIEGDEDPQKSISLGGL